ncbi:hypothetical protein BGZ73_004064 [Actinomortierella ambigua]|nr:hypothetical protein BGZ73_004064 [Actinomortierella ambigua]
MSTHSTFVDNLLEEYWGFLQDRWPVYVSKNKHRTELKDVKSIDYVKRVLWKRLGIIPVYFFLVLIWSQWDYPGPYRTVDKGLLVLYYLVRGVPTDAMDDFIPKSSFYALYEAFFRTNHSAVNRLVTDLMKNMFSNIKVRIAHAKAYSPEGFKHVTLMLDGHDTRASYTTEDKALAYSYKLKKKGVRTQVCIDIQGMAIFTSKSDPCAAGNDGTMLQDMKIHRSIHELDCVALDGGYNLYIGEIVDSTHLTMDNFAIPIRKKLRQDLTEKDVAYNNAFGSSRPTMENTFGVSGFVSEIRDSSRLVSFFRIRIVVGFVSRWVRLVANRGIFGFVSFTIRFA